MPAAIRFLIGSIAALCLVSPLQAQSDISGDWLGTLEAGGGITVRIVFHIEQDEQGELSTTMDSPDQGAKGIPTGSTTFDNGKLEVKIPAAAAGFEGALSADGSQFEGTWKQGGASLPLVIKRVEGGVQPPNRPQEPKEPLPYEVQQVTFENQTAGITLAGTLTVPKGQGPFPGVVLVSGSGPQNRDEELLGHRPFLVLSDYLTRQGIAVLRYDDRGVGESKGSFTTATSADFATDALAAVQFLRARSETDPAKVGIAGHSEGGLIAPMVAAESQDVAFIVLMGGPGITGEEILYLQGELIARANGASEEDIKKSRATQKEVFSVLKLEGEAGATEKVAEVVRRQLEALTPEERKAAGISDDQKIDQIVFQQTAQVATPWFRYFLSHDPAPTLERVKQPVLAISGGNDLQVPPEANMKAIEAALRKGGNSNFEIVVMEGLNHLFQESETGSPSEYAQIEQTWSPQALSRIGDWILKVTR
jgi:fermentation-respiration switch protein FrsA (DUF1100 family)